MSNIGRVIQILRRARNLNAAELAKRAGISAATLSMIECGRRTGPEKAIQAIADALGVRLELLTDDVDGMDEFTQSIFRKINAVMLDEHQLSLILNGKKP